MTNALAIIRSLVIYSLCLPLAIFLGYLLAMPMDAISFTVILVVLALPLIPIMLQWHHVLLVASWNASMVLFFLPGRPSVWIGMTLGSLLISVLHQILNRDTRYVSVPSLTRPLLLLAIVILVTAKLTGGIGMRVFGGDTVGGKRYVVLLAAIAGYFAITYVKVAQDRVSTYFTLYILGYLVGVIGSIGPLLFPGFTFLFALFPVENLRLFTEDTSFDFSLRLGGLSIGCVAIFYFILARHGIRGLFDLSERWHFLPFRFRGGLAFNQPWRMLIWISMIWMSLLAGYRSIAIGLGLIFFLQFFLEGMHRTQLLPILALGMIAAFAISIPLVNKLPYTIQRSLAFIPILDLDPIARFSAENSTEWRKNIWREVIPTIPRYLILGKGYAINANELAVQQTHRSDGGEGAMLAGDYHNGPLSVIIPLGIFGTIAFIWLLGAGVRVLWYNYRYGDPANKQINTFLLAAFIARIISFCFVFGSLHSELPTFIGMIAMSVCMNGGMKRPVLAPVEKQTFNQFKLARAEA